LAGAAEPRPATSNFFMPVSREFEQHLMKCDETALTGLLRALQARLGTPHEGPDDVDRAAAVMHQINNLRTMRAFAQEAFPPEDGGGVSST
jgi:hypothetical protein